MSEWDGKNRRDSSDHELLTIINERLGTFIIELKDVKKRVDWHDKIIYLGLGGLAVIEIIFKLNTK